MGFVLGVGSGGGRGSGVGEGVEVVHGRRNFFEKKDVRGRWTRPFVHSAVVERAVLYGGLGRAACEVNGSLTRGG